MKKIEPFKIIGRSGHSCTLTKLKPKKYLLSFVEPFFRIGGDEGGIQYVDPSGGPFIGINTVLKDLHAKLPNKSILSIDRNQETGYIVIITN